MNLIRSIGNFEPIDRSRRQGDRAALPLLIELLDLLQVLPVELVEVKDDGEAQHKEESRGDCISG